eukprot:scaffold15443_cov50-Cyclotella_meneghiniana.AAC.3
MAKANSVIARSYLIVSKDRIQSRIGVKRSYLSVTGLFNSKRLNVELQVKRAIQDMDVSSQIYRHLVSRRYMRMASHSYELLEVTLDITNSERRDFSYSTSERVFYTNALDNQDEELKTDPNMARSIKALHCCLILTLAITPVSGLITVTPMLNNPSIKPQGAPKSTVLHLSSESPEDNTNASSAVSSKESSISKLLQNFRTASSEGFGTRARNVASTCQVGDIVVPLCGNLEKRQVLADRGVYPGVEYVISNLTTSTTNDAANERIATIRPAYPLRTHLERSDWPISVPLSDVPLWLSKATYEAGTALGTLMLSASLLGVAAVAASVLRLAVIPSESMIPALMPGDVVLVTRSIFPPKAGDVVFFDPPSSLDEAIANSKIGRAATAAAKENGVTSNDSSGGGGASTTPISIVSTKGKQFIKRVVGVPGERVGVYNSNPYVVINCGSSKNSEKDDGCKYRVDHTGQYSRPDIFDDQSWNRDIPTINTNWKKERNEIDNNNDNNSKNAVLGKNDFFVAGDNGYRSVDSRVWGPLNRRNIFGTAQFIVFPPSHFGRISNGNISIDDVLQ